MKAWVALGDAPHNGLRWWVKLKSNLNSQIAAYSDDRTPKQHDTELLGLVSADHPRFNGRFLDIGCAAGSFISLMASAHPEATYQGIDISEQLIGAARNREISADVDFLVADVLDFEPLEKVDIVVASGVLSIFDDFSIPLKRWLTWLRPGGNLYIFGRFNSEHVDTITYFRNNVYESADWEGGLTSYSTQTVLSFVNQLGFEGSFKKFHLPFDLARNPLDPIRTFTVTTVDGQRLVLNGANIVAEHYFLKIGFATV